MQLIPLTFMSMLGLAAIYDFLTFTIPNWICALLAVLFFPSAVLLHMQPAVLAAHVACGFTVLAATFLLFQFGWVGGGDAKLAAAASVWLGWSNLPVFLLQTALWGGCLSIFLLLLRSLRLSGWAERQGFISRLIDPTAGVPYGVALAAGGLLSFPHSDLWRLSGGA